MGEDKNTPLLETIGLTEVKGYSLRAGVFFAWLKRNDYRLWQVAKFVHIKKSILYSKLSNKSFFNKLQVHFYYDDCPKWQERNQKIQNQNTWVKEQADKFIWECADAYTEENVEGSRVIWQVKREDCEEVYYLHLKDERDYLTEYLKCKAGVIDADLTMQEITITLERDYVDKLKAGEVAQPSDIRKRVDRIADELIQEGRRNTTEGNYVTFFEELGEDRAFVEDNLPDIKFALENRMEVSDVEVTDECLDINFYLQYCPQYEEKQEDGLDVRSLDDEEDEEWENAIQSGAIKPIERGQKTEEGGQVRDETPVIVPIQPEKTEENVEGNTDLTAIGFDQKELGGAKQRFRNNIEAIKLVNRLEKENRAATDEEKKVLSKFVGWGGLSQVFDEKNVGWYKEYAELKSTLDAAD